MTPSLNVLSSEMLKFNIFIYFSGDCEKRIIEYRGQLTEQQRVIRVRREEKKRLEAEAAKLRHQADVNAMQGCHQQQLRGRTPRSQNMLEEAERCMREAFNKERDASDLERTV